MNVSTAVTDRSGEICRRESLRAQYRRMREFTLQLCAPLETEDFVIQSMPDVSPTRWHLAHATWFFETFVLRPSLNGYRPANPQFEYLFNSYYNSVGSQFPRWQRGLLSRPTVNDVMAYRRQVDESMETLFDRLEPGAAEGLLSVIELGIHHEQQHQELLLTDIKHVFSCNPLHPVYASHVRPTVSRVVGGDQPPETSRGEWIEGARGIQRIGHEGDRFSFDNERPRHQVLLSPHRIASRLVTCGAYREFIEDGGYDRPELWLSLGWQVVRQENWQAPLYWVQVDGRWHQFTLHGLQPVRDEEPVCHVSYFEADAFARWRGVRLPLEGEWEALASQRSMQGSFVEGLSFHPRASHEAPDPTQFFGEVWQWTASPYIAYPGYRADAGALGEYNGKFMCNQLVLRGGSCATSDSHIRSTYRNFFPPEARWQFAGIRLAQDAAS